MMISREMECSRIGLLLIFSAMALMLPVCIVRGSCPDDNPAWVWCPEIHPVCPTSGGCTGDGSVLSQGLFECEYYPGKHCVRPDEPMTQLCYTVYPCVAVGTQCVPNTSGGISQQYNKLIYQGMNCTIDPP